MFLKYEKRNFEDDHDFHDEANCSTKKMTSTSDVPLIFIPGLKTSYLSYYCHNEKSGCFDFLSPNDYLCGCSGDEESCRKGDSSSHSMNRSSDTSSVPSQERYDANSNHEKNKYSVNDGSNQHQMKKKRVWISIPSMLNFPPLPDDHPSRSIDLPLTYTNGIQDKGHLFADGIVDHAIDVGPIKMFTSYGHLSVYLKQLDNEYTLQNSHSGNHTSKGTTNTKEGESHELKARPTAVFPYDWRRSVPELSQRFYEFCESKFPNQPVQVLAHSYGGLVAFDAMRAHPEKYKAGGVFVGVPFQPGSQYIQDLHRGNFTRSKRCRQMTPPTMFTFANHWVFYPLDKDELGDRFVDVSDEGDDVSFEENNTLQGRKIPKADGVTSAFRLDAVKGKQVDIDFYNVDDWERLELGIFNPEYEGKFDEAKQIAYKKHMEIQLNKAKEWRLNVMRKELDNKDDFPSLVMCGTNTIPTVNQVLRRRRKKTVKDQQPHNIMSSLLTASAEKQQCTWEYDYASGRSVPGDGRIDYIGTYPGLNLNMKKVVLDSPHVKQLCWEDGGGNLSTILREVNKQLYSYMIPLRTR